MHRVGQFLGHVRARVGEEEAALAHGLLSRDAVVLFEGMPIADRRHGIDVAAKLLSDGHDSPDLLGAALLHDAAKGRRSRLWHRVAGVVLDAVAPRLLRRLASEQQRSWRHPFWIYLHHDRLSAELAERAGCSAVTVRLIRGLPQGSAETQLHLALKAADDAS